MELTGSRAKTRFSAERNEAKPMGRAVAFVVVAVLTVFLILRLATPSGRGQGTGEEREKGRRGEGENNAPITQSPNDPIAQRPNNPIQETPPNPIETPRNAERRTYEQTEEQRAPFYALLRNNYQYIIVVRPAPDDQAVLEIYMTTDDPYVSSELAQKEIAPNGTKYGFEKVRFYQPSISGSAERYRLDAEATTDRRGVWTTFRH